jgi:hypothetical protein
MQQKHCQKDKDILATTMFPGVWNREILSFSTELRRISSLTYTKVIIGEHGCDARKIEKNQTRFEGYLDNSANEVWGQQASERETKF